MNELDSLLRAARRMMLDYQSPKVFSKGHHADFVTEADIAVQSYLVDALQRAYPRAKFLAEEEDRHVLTDALTFIIEHRRHDELLPPPPLLDDFHRRGGK